MPTTHRRRAAQGAAALLLLFLAGCGKPPPTVTEVEGVVFLDDKPLPSASVQFLPELELGPEWVSTAITDKDGKFTLNLEMQQKPGAAVALHRVIVHEGPLPEGARGMDETSQQKMTVYLNSLANRPIPKVYGAAGTTPTRVEVKEGQKSYEIRLERPK